MTKTKFIGFALAFVLVFVSVPQIQKLEAQNIIYIRADGTVEGTDKIQLEGSSYWFTGNISGTVTVEKDNIVIDGNGNTLTSAEDDGFYLNYVSNVTIKNARIEGCNNGFFLYSSFNNTLTGNTISGNTVGIYMQFSRDSLITKNIVQNNDQAGTYCHRTNNLIISNNQITNNGQNGIEFSSSTVNCYVAENKIMNNGFNGIRIDWASNTTIIGNSIQNNAEDGIRVYESRNNTFSKNNINNNTANGIQFTTYSFDNLIFLNNITSNSEYGLKNNQYSGINLIHHNNFIDNGHQAKNYPGETNTWGWDNGLSSGGNYWSDYKGTDSNGDGIGDSSYNIGGNNQDNYPLMNPADINTNQKFTTIPEFNSWTIYSLTAITIIALTFFRKKLTKRQKQKSH